MQHQPFEQFFKKNFIRFSKEEKNTRTKEKMSQKEADVFCREVLKNNPTLKDKIVDQAES